MKVRAMILWAASACLVSAVAGAQSRGDGWEFEGDLIYQTSQDVDFDGGSTVAFEDDIGFSLSAGYRFSDRLEVQFGVDWSTVEYDANFASDLPGVTFSAQGEMEALTPFAKVNFNFLEGPITPYVTAGLGWAFIDTNIPDGPPETTCWYDPWWGYYCGTFQSTRSTDALTYDVGLGLRWDMSTGYSFRLAYEKHWYDVDGASSAPEFDRINLGIVFRY